MATTPNDDTKPTPDEGAPKYYTTPESAARIKKEEDAKQNALNSPVKATPKTP